MPRVKKTEIASTIATNDELPSLNGVEKAKSSRAKKADKAEVVPAKNSTKGRITVKKTKVETENGVLHAKEEELAAALVEKKKQPKKGKVATQAKQEASVEHKNKNGDGDGDVVMETIKPKIGRTRKAAEIKSVETKKVAEEKAKSSRAKKADKTEVAPTKSPTKARGGSRKVTAAKQAAAVEHKSTNGEGGGDVVMQTIKPKKVPTKKAAVKKSVETKEVAKSTNEEIVAVEEPKTKAKRSSKKTEDAKPSTTAAAAKAATKKEKKAPAPKTTKTVADKKKKKLNDAEDEEETAPKEKTTKKPTSRKRVAAAKTAVDDDEDGEPEPTKVKKALLNPTETSYNKSDFELSNKDANRSDVSNSSYESFKISSWNVAGLRAWVNKGGLKFLEYENPDIFCVQETKCTVDHLPDEAKRIPGYHPYWLCLPGGHAGVAVYSKIMPIHVEYGIGNEEFDKAGRLITAEYEKFYLLNVYVPNSGRKLVNLEARMRWEKLFQAYVKKYDALKPVIICGDMNVSHTEIDLANPKANQRSAGFTIEEREKMSELLALGFVDTFRMLYPKKLGAYTYWTYMANSRSRNVGWRLDYFLVSERFCKRVYENVIRSNVMGSDHCPITLFIQN